jgi:hypothetical protein
VHEVALPWRGSPSLKKKKKKEKKSPRMYSILDKKDKSNK